MKRQTRTTCVVSLLEESDTKRCSSRDLLAPELGIADFIKVDVRPRYKIAPSQSVEAIIRHGAGKHLGPMKWGFTSSSDKDSHLAPHRLSRAGSSWRI